MTCPLCKGEMKPGTTIHTVQLKNCVVVIKNVPCLKCEQCGEVVLSADTVEKMEMVGSPAAGTACGLEVSGLA